MSDIPIYTNRLLIWRNCSNWSKGQRPSTKNLKNQLSREKAVGRHELKGNVVCCQSPGLGQETRVSFGVHRPFAIWPGVLSAFSGVSFLIHTVRVDSQCSSWGFLFSESFNSQLHSTNFVKYRLCARNPCRARKPRSNSTVVVVCDFRESGVTQRETKR